MAASGLLLDTCAAIWITEDGDLSAEAVQAMDDAYDADLPVQVSPITAWERGMLSSKRRLASPIPPLQWFNRLVSDAGLTVSAMTPEILIESSFLPGQIHGDPADRIIIATARSLSLMIITRDEGILRYAAEGHVRAIAC